ncbi:hypothetical protein N2152v2_001138 [Parachlorella kessleri]
MSSIDSLFQKLRKQEARRPTESVARFVVTKLSWRGNYKRLLCITPSAIVTQYADTLAVTNSWAYAGDHDLAAIEVGGEHAEGGVFTLHFRRDKKGLKSKDAKFACKERAALLSALYQNISFAAARGVSGLGPTILGSPDSFSGHKLKKGQWVPVALRVTAYAVERVDPATGALRWRLEFRHMASPAARLLSPAGTTGSGAQLDLTGTPAAPAPQGQAVFALFRKTGRSPRVYSCRDREGFLKQMQTAALKKLGVTLAVDTNAQLSGPELLVMVGRAERERAAGQGEAPLGEWEVTRVCDMDSAGNDLAASKMDGAGGTGRRVVVQRRLVLTQSGLLERRLATYEVAEWRQLAAVAAVVRYAEDPQWLAVEWTDGAPTAVYLTPAREALLAALLDAAQASAGRPIPVLTQPTGSGDVVVAHRSQAVGAPVAELDVELERLCMGHLAAAARDLMISGGGALSLAALAQAGLLAGGGATGGNWGPLSPEGSNTLGPSGAALSDAGSDDQEAGGSDVGSPQTGNRGGFMRRAFTRQQGSGGTLSAAQQAQHGSPAAVEGPAGLFQQRVREFNACVPLSGVSAGCKVEDAAIAALLAHLPRQQQQSAADKVLGQEEGRVAVAALQCLQRLAANLGAAGTIVGPAGGAGRIFASLQCGSDHVAFEAARLLTRLFAPAACRAGAGPWQLGRGGGRLSDADLTSLNSADETAAARAAKSVCFISDTRCAMLTSALKAGGGHGQSALVSMAVAEALAAAVCEPGARTTDPHTLTLLLQEAAAMGHPLFALFSHPAPRVAEAAALLMRAIAEGGSDAAEPMRAAALSEGAILHHLLNALGPQSPRAKLSQELVAVWADEYSPALALLRRIFPPGLMRYLNSRPRPPAAAPPAPRQRLPAREAQHIPPTTALPGTAAIAASATPAAVSQQAAAIPDPLHLQPGAGLASPGGQQRAAAVANPLSPPSPQQVMSAQHAQHPQQQQQQPGGVAQQPPAVRVQGPGLHSAADGARPPSPLAKRFFSAPADKEQPSLRCNWDGFWAAVGRDHSHAGLIWNERTRSELREALQTEESLLRMARMRASDGSGVTPSWNHLDFRQGWLARKQTAAESVDVAGVSYPSLAKHLCVGGTYVKLLLDGSDADAVEKLAAPRDFFTAAYHHFLCLGDPCLYPPSSAALFGAGGGGVAANGVAAPSAAVLGGVGSIGSPLGESSDPMADRELCVRAMAATYAVHAAAIGPFEGVAPTLRLLDATPSTPLRHHLLRLVAVLVVVPPGKESKSNQAAAEAGAGAGSSSTNSRAVAAGGAATAAAASPAAESARRANAVAIVGAGGVELLVDLLTTAHEAADRPVTALAQSNLIAASSFAEERKEWYYYPAAAAAAAAVPSHQQQGQGPPSDLESGRQGPVSKEELRQLAARASLTPATLVWVAGMPQPQPLGAVRELRWWTARGLGPMTPFEVACTALKVLLALARLHPATVAGSSSSAQGEATSYSQALFPLPLAHRQMASQRCLPHIAQLVLTAEPSLVSATCELLHEVLAHNPGALAGLYRTGIFFFLLAYCGSNLQEAAALLKASHLHQHFRGAREAAAAGQPLAQRSILGGLLPESLLYQLESYGPEAFAAALVGDSDTPELIWTHRMRGQRLVPQMLQHLGDFPRRLAQHAHAAYDYTPCPPVGYPELEGELFCRRYYLRHLCDEDRFPRWPLVDHVPFLQALLDEWRAELARKPLSMSETEACRVLGLEPREGAGGAVSEDELKAAYRRQVGGHGLGVLLAWQGVLVEVVLARLYHPDKNPEGRDKFMAVHKAYERLQAGAAGGQGPQPWRVLLILKAQCILFRRYPEVLQPFKYAGYPLLLQAITLPANGGAEGAQQQAHFLSPEAAVQLCWLTCACSALNGEELTRSGGVGLLGDLLSRCVAVIPRDVAPTQPAAVIATQSLRALAVMAAFASARADLAARPQLVADIVWCCGLERAAAAVDGALLAIIQMSQTPELQGLLLRSGVLGWVVPLLLAFDTTHDEGEGGGGLPPALDIGQGGRSVPDFLGLGVDRPNMQAARNLHGMLAVRALASLAGYPGIKPATRPSPEAQGVLRALLTETLAPRLADPDPRPLLRDLNTTVQTPQVIWNNRMREELLELMTTQREAFAKGTITSAPQAGASGMLPTDSAASLAPRDFAYSSLKGELVVAGVFVRVYNEQPSFALSDAAAFCKGLVTWLHASHQRGKQQAERGGDKGAAEGPQEQQHTTQALLALRHVLEANPRLLGLLSTRPALEPLLDCVAPACTLGHAGPLWPTQQQPLQPPLSGQVDGAELSLGVLLRLTAHAGCIEALAQERCVLQSYWLVHRPPTSSALMLALRLLHALAGTPACAWSAAAHAGTLYLLTLLLPASLVSDESDRSVLETGRVAAASLLGRILAQPLHGPRVALILGKMLPPGLVALIQDGSGEAVVAALGQTSETPERLWNRSMYQAAAEEAGGQLEWSLPEGYRLQQEGAGAGEELFIGGVYVRLFLKQPQYPLRNPKAFLEALLERYLAVLQAATPTAPSMGSPVRGGSLGPAAAAAGAAAPARAPGVIVPAAGTGVSPATGSDADLGVLLSAAAVAVLQHHGLLAEHVVALGYVDKLLKVLAARLPALPPGGLTADLLDAQPPLAADDLTGSILRLLHQLSSSLPAAEALARCPTPAVPTLSCTLLCGTAAGVLGLETLKRALTPANRSRDLLVGACLGAGLPQVLLARLDWRTRERAEQEEDRDEAVQRVLFVDLLNLLAAGGAYAERMQALLDASDVWRAYRDQRHDLFLPAGGAPGAGVVGLLKGPEVTRYALPPALTTSPSAGEEAVVVAPPPAPPPAAVMTETETPQVQPAEGAPPTLAVPPATAGAAQGAAGADALMQPAAATVKEEAEVSSEAALPPSVPLTAPNRNSLQEGQPSEGLRPGPQAAGPPAAGVIDIVRDISKNFQPPL